MRKWWHLHPIIAPLPKEFMDNDPSHKEAKEWMLRATEDLDRMEAWLELIQSAGAADDMDPKDAWAEAAMKGWSVDDLMKQKIPFTKEPLPDKPTKGIKIQ